MVSFHVKAIYILTVPVSLETFLEPNILALFLRKLRHMQSFTSVPPLTCSQTKGVKFHWMRVMNIFIYVVKMGHLTQVCVCFVCCHTCIHGCVWWWHGQLCSSARRPWSSRRRCAALDKPPFQQLGANSRLNGPEWFCCLQVLNWWTPSLKNKEMRYCYMVCRSKVESIFIGVKII